MCRSEITVYLMTSHGIRNGRFLMTKWQVLDIDHFFHRLWTVMGIFRSRFYRLNVILLSIVGLWPYRKFKSLQLFYTTICHMTALTLILTLVIKLFEIWGDLDIMIECLTPLGVQLAAVVKGINCIVNREKMTKLLEKMQKDWSILRNENEIEILMKYTNAGRNLTILYTVFLYSSSVIYLLVPLLPKFLDVIVPLNESRAYEAVYPTEHYVDPKENFLWISLHTYSATMIGMTFIIAADTMFVCYVMHVCGVLAVIGYRLENLTSKHSNTDINGHIKSEEDDDRCYQEIVFCIDQHFQATEAVKIIESSYSISYLLVLGIAVLLLSISAVQLLIKFGQVGEMIRLFQFNLAQFTHLLFNSWPCQNLIDESEKFRYSLYASEWYLLSKGNKNLLRFTMLRTLEPQTITAGKLYIMSIENFGVVIQTSMSYFTVFASVR